MLPSACDTQEERATELHEAGAIAAGPMFVTATNRWSDQAKRASGRGSIYALNLCGSGELATTLSLHVPAGTPAVTTAGVEQHF